ncbi:MAG: putative Nek4 protein, partial [Streblomastix strix]
TKFRIPSPPPKISPVSSVSPYSPQQLHHAFLSQRNVSEFNTTWKKSDFRKVQRLGKGSFGEVWLIEELSTNEQMAWKKMDYSTKEERKIADNEIKMVRDSYEIFHSSNSPFLHVIKPLGFFLNDSRNEAFLVLEYCSGGDLHSYIKDMISKGLEISDAKAFEIIGQVGSAIHQLHSHRIIHGDLKLSNVLLTSDFKVKLADFGLARVLRDGRT